MRIASLSLALLLIVVSGASALGAQGPAVGGPDAILVAAARYVRTQDTLARVVAIDPRVLNGGAVPAGGVFLAERPSDRTRVLAGPLGAHVQTVDGSINCQAGLDRRQCRLAGADLVIAVGEPVVQGTTATVAVSSWRQVTTPRGPAVNTRDQLLTLVLMAGRWQVTKAELKRIT